MTKATNNRAREQQRDMTLIFLDRTEERNAEARDAREMCARDGNADEPH
jgi:hypothetical protein